MQPETNGDPILQVQSNHYYRQISWSSIGKVLFLIQGPNYIIIINESAKSFTKN